MKKILVSIFACSAIALSVAWHPTSAAETKEPINVEQLFESKCSIYHSIDRPKSKKKQKKNVKQL